MASVFPVLVSLGVSRLSAVSVITACTAIGMGPASAMSNKAAEFAFGDSDMIISYFTEQLQLAIPISLVFVLVYYFTNKYFDSKEHSSDLINGKDNNLLECPAYANNVVDRVGAGDSMLAIISLLIKIGAPRDLSLLLGSFAGAFSVETIANSSAIKKSKLLRFIEYSLKNFR